MKPSQSDLTQQKSTEPTTQVDLACTSGSSPPNVNAHNETRRCKNCGITRAITDFPKKDGLRLEANCKDCFNRIKRQRRRFKSRKNKKRLHCFVQLSDNVTTDWSTPVIQIILSFSSKSQNQEAAGVAEVMNLVCGKKNRVLELLEERA